MLRRSGDEFFVGRYVTRPTIVDDDGSRIAFFRRPLYVFRDTVPPSRLAITGSVGESTRSRCLHPVVVVGDKIDWSL